MLVTLYSVLFYGFKNVKEKKTTFKHHNKENLMCAPIKSK